MRLEKMYFNDLYYLSLFRYTGSELITSDDSLLTLEVMPRDPYSALVSSTFRYSIFRHELV